MDTRQVDVEELRQIVRDAVADRPPSENWFHTWPRPLMKWMCIVLIPVAAFYSSEAKFEALLLFAAALYGLRELGKANNKWAENDRYSGMVETRREPIFDDD